MTVNGSGNAKAGPDRSGSRSLGGDLVEKVVDDRLHVGAQGLDPSRRESCRHEPPQPGVIGRVDGEHVPGEVRSGKALGHDS